MITAEGIAGKIPVDWWLTVSSRYCWIALPTANCQVIQSIMNRVIAPMTASARRRLAAHAMAPKNATK